MNRVLIFAGGVGTRLKNKNGTPKQFLQIFGKEIIVHTIEKFENNKNIDDIIVVCVKDWIDYLSNLIQKFNIKKVSKILPGGETGFDSRVIGLQELSLSPTFESDIVLVHDGVRPIIDDKLIDENIECCKKNGNAITVAQAAETIIYKSESGDKIINRANCLLARAPQTFFAKEIFELYQRALKDNQREIIDSASVAHFYKIKLNYVEGASENLKVTTPIDYYIVKALFDAEEAKKIF